MPVETLFDQFLVTQAIRDDQLQDKWNDKASYPNLATAKVSYIAKDGKLHIKEVKSSNLSKSKAVKQYTKHNSHSEGQIFKYVEELIQSDPKYKKSKKIIVDIHTKIDMCSAKKK